MHLKTRAALLIALAPNLACPMIHIAGEQAESASSTTSGASTTTTSSTSTALSTSGSTSGAEGGNSGTSSTSSSSSTGHQDDNATTISLASTSDDTSTSTGEQSTSDGSKCGPDDECHEGPGCDLTTCKLFCGDGIINGPPSSEQCDDGISNGAGSISAPAFCTKTCARSGRYAFITSKNNFTGKLAELDQDNPRSGIDAADAYCSEAAKAIPDVGENPQFIAWLSVWNDDVSHSPSTRLNNCTRPYFLRKPDDADAKTKRLLIAWDYQDLTTINLLSSNYLRNSIFLTEHGVKVFNESVLTATLENGMPDKSSGNCSLWTSEADQTTTGQHNLKDSRWTNKQKSPCSTPAHLYCFEQCPP
jgi:hypothetical protein